MTPTSIVAYIALFAATGFLFIFVTLLLGKLLRARVPTPEKGETYECGERTVGTSFVQFDLRFYVVALLFIIFEVEVAFFFPWATVFGKAVQLKDPGWEKAVAASPASGHLDAPAPAVRLSPAVEKKFRELGIRHPAAPRPDASADENARRIERGAGELALAAAVDVAVFFAVLLVGFAYVWYRGDLNWVRAADRRRASSARPEERTAPTATTP